MREQTFVLRLQRSFEAAPHRLRRQSGENRVPVLEALNLRDLEEKQNVLNHEVVYCTAWLDTVIGAYEIVRVY